jgi:histidine triad (HIT) family protein
MSCIFCSIIDGKLPSYKIHEDEHFLVILDRFPATAGEVLILSKRHEESISGLNFEESSALMPLTQMICEKMKNALNPAGINILQNNGKAAGQEIMHYHLHVIPRYDKQDGYTLHKKSSDPPLEELERMAELLKS